MTKLFCFCCCCVFCGSAGTYLIKSFFFINFVSSSFAHICMLYWYFFLIAFKFRNLNFNENQSFFSCSKLVNAHFANFCFFFLLKSTKINSLSGAFVQSTCEIRIKREKSGISAYMKNRKSS